MTGGEDPLSDSEFATLMAQIGPYASDRRVVVGVSGGADSMALALLLSRWGKPLACVVDHGLRTGSAAEAARTAQRLAAIGVPARIVRADLRPGPAAAERAREARYALLLQACADAGCADLLVAHHAGDQAETVRMRADAGSGPRGLAGMAATTYMERARLLRPLLTIPASRLRATLRAAGLSWEEDPTNRDLRTLRARLRATEADGITAAALERAAEHGPARRERDGRIAAELAGVALFPEAYAIVPEPLGPDALAGLIWTLSGRPYPPPVQACQGMIARTTHGVLIRRAGRLGSGWLLAREPAAAAPKVPARPGAVWDGRFRLASDPGPGLTIGALGADAARFRRRSPLPSVVLQTLPALRRGEEVVLVPHLAFPDAATCRSVRIWFSPSRPAAGAPFVPAVNPAEGLGGA